MIPRRRAVRAWSGLPAKGQRPTWRPIGLIWSKRVRGRALKLRRPARQITASSTILRLGLHFNFPIAMRSTTAAALGDTRNRSVVRWAPTRGHRASSSAMVRALFAMRRRTITEHARRDLATESQSISISRISEIRQVLHGSATRPRPTRRFNARHQPPPACARPDRIEFVSRVSTIAQVDRDRARQRFDRIPLPCRRTVERLAEAPDRPAPVTWHMPELVWMSTTESRASEAIERYAGSHSPGVIASLTPAYLEQPLDAAASLRAQMLDPATIDRFAEDVMGRMERRMRIERERRGL
jgi:hypothetical protein